MYFVRVDLVERNDVGEGIIVRVKFIRRWVVVGVGVLKERFDMNRDISFIVKKIEGG